MVLNNRINNLGLEIVLYYYSWMKGISSQLDSLVDVLKKNIFHRELLHSRDIFQMVYQKITQQTFKIISVMVDNFIDDIGLKLSYSTFLKQLKTFLSLKPDANEDQSQQYFAQEYDQVKQFMNNRKPVMAQTDAGQRGDIYKFLYQAQNKQKDIAQFIGNVDKFNVKANKKFQQTSHKWKKRTIINTHDEVATQTHLNLTLFKYLQNSFPGIFPTPQQPQTDTNQQVSTTVINLQAKIQQMVNQRIEEKTKLIEQEKKVKESEEKVVKKEVEKKKKTTTTTTKVGENKRNSQLNVKRNSGQAANNSSLKHQGKSQFSNNSYKKQTVLTENGQKPQPLYPINQVSQFQTVTNDGQNNNTNGNQVKLTKEQAGASINKKESELKNDNIGGDGVGGGKMASQQNQQSQTQTQAQSRSHSQAHSLSQVQSQYQPQLQSHPTRQAKPTHLDSESNIHRTQQLLPTFQTFFSTISESNKLQGVSSEQIKSMYKLFKNQFEENMNKNHCHLYSTIVSEKINTTVRMNNRDYEHKNSLSEVHYNGVYKIETQEKSVNTQNNLYWDNCYQQNKRVTDSRLKFHSRGYPNSSSQTSQNRLLYTEKSTNNIKQDHSPSNSLQRNKRNSKFAPSYHNSIQSYNNSSNKFYTQINQTQLRNKQNQQQLSNEKYNHSVMKNSLPQIVRPNDNNDKSHSMKASDSVELLAKDGKITDEYLKRLKDTKHFSSAQNIKVFTKQRYTLDMYKVKEHIASRIKPPADSITLPILCRFPDKSNTSLHDQVQQQIKNLYLKKLQRAGKKRTVYHSSMQSLTVKSREEQNENESESDMRRQRKSKEDGRQEERIMNELTKISNEGSLKLNLRNVARLISAVESIHWRRCGQKCVHLERFYLFLTRHNIPNRKEYYMHKADINSSVNI